VLFPSQFFPLGFSLFEDGLYLRKFQELINRLEGNLGIGMDCFVINHFIHVVRGNRPNYLFALFIIPHFSILVKRTFTKLIELSERPFFVDLLLLLFVRDFSVKLTLNYFFPQHIFVLFINVTILFLFFSRLDN
jgi:hypothetical protein